jgi:acyl-CoA dehydrogenase
MLSKPMQSILTVKHLTSLTKQTPVAAACNRIHGHRQSSSSTSSASSGGLNFTLTEDQLSIRDMARKFAREEIAPVAAAHDRSGEYPRDLINKAHQLGIMTGHLPESVGGQGMGLLDSCKLLLSAPFLMFLINDAIFVFAHGID